MTKNEYNELLTLVKDLGQRLDEIDENINYTRTSINENVDTTRDDINRNINNTKAALFKELEKRYDEIQHEMTKRNCSMDEFIEMCNEYVNIKYAIDDYNGAEEENEPSTIVWGGISRAV